MHRHLKILEFALVSLLRRKYKNFSLVAAYALIVTVLAAILFLTHALKTEARHLLAGAPELIVQKVSAGRHDLIPAGLAREIAGIPGVGTVRPRVWGYYYDALTQANFTLLAADAQPPGLEMLAGRLPAAPGECAIGRGVAEIRGVNLEEDLILIDSANLGVTFAVVGIFRAPSQLLTNDLVVLDRADLRDFFGYTPDQATDIMVEVFNPKEVENIAGKIKRLLPDTRPITRQEILRTYEGVFNWRSGMMLTLFSSALLAFCILAWDKATGISAEERREIGILKAIGWETSHILELKFWEGLAVSLTSLLLGLVAAYLLVFFFGAPVLAPVLKGWSVLFPDFQLIPFVDFYQVLSLAVLTVTPYVASTVIPSWKAAVTDPESAMRG